MKFSRPAWVGHHDTSSNTTASAQKRPPIYSVHVHPDSSRIATGGMDSKVRIWSTRPILNEASEKANKPPKMLCTLSMHTGPVLCVRWAYSGRWLASGSDDTVIMIWDLDPTGGGRVWGSDDVNVEGWKPLKRLPGHESDVTDLAWSPKDRYLASVGLDSTAIIWCGYSLERLHRISLHNGFVKGVCWDPVGEFLATASDDRSVKIWRASDWGLEASITTPFEDSPGSTFFRRLSWSPDGAHITASNATNQNGLVFIATVILRDQWTHEISLVGHENTVEVAACNPRMFLREEGLPAVTNNICSVVALGADDRSVSVWQTKAPRPVIVAKSVFERSIMDLSWSSDGLNLYAVSSDGTLGVFTFEPHELGGVASHDEQKQYLRKYNFIPAPLPGGFVHPGQNGDTSSSQPVRPIVAAPQGEVVNTLVAKRKDKSRNGARRVNLIGNVPSAGVPSASTPSQLPRVNGYAAPSLPTPSVPRPSNTVQQATSSSYQRTPSAPNTNTGVTTDGFGYEDSHMDDVHNNPNISGDVASFAHLDTSSPQNPRRTSGDMLGEEGRLKPRTLGGDQQRQNVPVRELTGPSQPQPYPVMASGSGNHPILPALPVLSVISARAGQGSSEALLEGKNTDTGAPSEVIYYSGKQTQWLDYVPSPVIAAATTANFSAIGMQDGTINVYSLTGRRQMPTLLLGAPCSYLYATEWTLLAVTSHGMLYSWNVKKGQANFPPASLASLIQQPNVSITSVSVRPNGAPIIHLSTGVAVTYDPMLCTFVQLADKWFMGESDAWQGRARGSNANRGVVGVVELTISETHTSTTSADDAASGSARPEWWPAALTLGHLDGKIHAARLLDSPAEYKQALLVYAQRLASEGFRGKAEELIKELFGPIYWRPGKGDSWSPTVAGLAKRDLLKDVLNIFARSKTLAKLAQDWQDVARKAAAED